MSDFVVSLPTDSGLSEALAHVQGVEFVEWDLDGPAPRERLDIVVPPYLGGNRPLAALEGVDVRLVQWQSIGYDGLAKYVSAEQAVANAATVHETSTAELAVGLAIAAQRGLADFVRQGDAGDWAGRSTPSLADRRVLLIGYGGVSQAIEARLAGFEVEISRLARTAREQQNLAGGSVAVQGFDALHAALADAEIVIIAVPLTAETTHLLDAEALAALPDGALIVNVARGPVIDTNALVAELTAGRLRAALDVTDPEPLPNDHPLWNAPNVLITPHVGGDSSAMLPRVAHLIERQIAHLQRGERPENLVLGEWN
ncbi:2-hydroxyacid dehydrogenase [Leucobacter musarum]|uniref:2-hydroxyacid dehydrogenase n=1 Tax=Leucobacter musarum TaxID=1930747 RepID=UPI0006A7C085|nr:2-hydroxyacid dehydrogenase [Leucobacter musarum]